MSVVTHVIPQFSDGQIFITPTVQQSQDIVVAQHTPVLTVPLTTALAPVQTIQLQTKLDPEIEREKQEIYKHPLFPLMALMFERCEQASSTPDFSGMDSFDSDIQAFVRHQEKENKSLLVEDEELNNLMIKAIQVLRIHLMELEKVSDLCKDFCTRYTNCLKGKLQSENLLRTESDYDQSMFDEPPPETPTKPSPNIATSSPGSVILQQPFQPSLAAMPTLGPGQLMSGGTVYQMVQTAQGLVAQPVQIQPTITSIAPPLIHGGTPLSQLSRSIQPTITSIAPPLIHGGTPLSQLGVPAPPVPSTNASPNSNIVNNLMSPGGFDSDDEDSSKKKNKRGVLPKSATQIMKSWLFQHIVHPYPTEDEKRQIASQTNLTLLQVNNWFINARRRILQPMLDAGNPDQSKTKKAKPQSKPSQRFINARRRILQPMLDAGNPDQSKAKKAKPQSKPSQRFWPFTTSSSDSSSGTSVKSEPDGQTIILPPHTFVGQSREPSLPEGVTGPLFTAVRIATPPSPGTNEKDNNSDNNNNNNQNTDNDHSEMSENEELT